MTTSLPPILDLGLYCRKELSELLQIVAQTIYAQKMKETKTNKTNKQTKQLAFPL